MFGLPWEKKPSNLKDNLEQVRVREFTDEEKRLFEEGKAKAIPKAPLRLTIRIKDIVDHGATVGCGGCKSAIKQARNRLPHSNGCRARFERLLRDEERAKTAKKRSDEFLEKVIEADDQKRNPKKAKIDETKPEEKAAEDVPVESESDEESEGEGKIVPSDGGENPGTGRRVRRKIINLLEGGSSTRVKDQRKVADDEDEMKWSAILVHAVERKMMGEESQRIYDDLTGKELNPEKVKAALRERWNS